MRLFDSEETRPYDVILMLSGEARLAGKLVVTNLSTTAPALPQCLNLLEVKVEGQLRGSASDELKGPFLSRSGQLSEAQIRPGSG